MPIPVQHDLVPAATASQIVETLRAAERAALSAVPSDSQVSDTRITLRRWVQGLGCERDWIDQEGESFCFTIYPLR